MKEKRVPFILERGSKPFVKTMLYDFYMFILLLVYYLLCLLLAPPALLLDFFFKTRKYTQLLKSFFSYVANL